ncbi:hypothetical protein SCHPADRAFT_899409 [Schizopora paradoxa]|uniref:Ribosomal protein mS38 C-terminal domain-containing protein n=1 Tax=Schizopora paradoxa TaxID=27342 RepID=A0A0H2S421_9AGAM|nr:hypothetical protein SCHPADRAFT_899409 [Schizopora paradoxa]
MSRIARGLLLPHLAGSRRAYSFFSNSNGGRYFTASKTAKVLAPNTKTSASKGATAGSSTAAVADAPSASSPASTGSDRNVPARQDAVDELSASSPNGSTPSADAAASHVNPSSLGVAVHATSQSDAGLLNASQSSPFPFTGHPTVKPHELKLHHFFSLHRPYLLLDQSVSKLFESHPAEKASSIDNSKNALLGTIDDPPEASPEADADAARQLSRALVVNRVGNTVNWDQTLARLGLQVEMEAPEVENVQIDLDSTKRKRRRKMKKHKLRKRRRLSRSTRLRLGK